MSSGEGRQVRSERIAVSTSVAVRSELGFYFGTLRWIEGTRALAELTAPLTDGEPLDIRVTLAPTRATALFRGRVARALVTAEGEAGRYLLELGECAAGERAMFDAWIANVRNRGTFSNFDTVVPAHHDREGGHSSVEIRQALERLARRPGLGSTTPSDSPFGPDSDLITNPGSVGGGRGAVRDALRSAIARTGGGRGAPVTPTPSGEAPFRAATPSGSSTPGRVVASTHPPRATPSGATPSNATPSIATRSIATPSTATPSSAPPSGATPFRAPPSGATPFRAPPTSTAPTSTAPPSTPSTFPYEPPLSPPADRIVRIGGTPPASTRREPSRAPPEPARTPPEPARPPTSDPTRSAAPPSRAPDAPVVHPPVRDPTYATTSTRTATWMEVAWHDPEAFERDARLQLLNYLLVVAKAEAALPDREPIRLAVRHGGFQLDCNAVVKAMGPNSATYRLDFDALQIERLRGWVADYGRK